MFFTQDTDADADPRIHTSLAEAEPADPQEDISSDEGGTPENPPSEPVYEAAPTEALVEAAPAEVTPVPAARRSQRQTRETPRPSTAAAEESIAVQEFGLLARARTILPARPLAALALTTEHKERFPEGSLSSEREYLAIRALAALNRQSEMRSRALRFQRRWPDSVYARAVGDLLSP